MYYRYLRICFFVVILIAAFAYSEEWILVFSGWSDYSRYSCTCLYNVPSMSESLIFDGIASGPKWSPSGEYFCGFPITFVYNGVIKLQGFDTIASFPGKLSFIHGDTLIYVSDDSIRQTMYFLPPPSFGYISDSVVFPDTALRYLAGVTNDGRFYLFIYTSGGPYNFQLYDRYIDSLWFLTDSMSTFYLSQKGFLVILKPVMTVPSGSICDVNIVNLYRMSDTITISHITGLSVLVGDIYSPIKFSNNDSVVYIPFSYPSSPNKNGILIFNVYTRTFVDTIDTGEFYQDTFYIIDNLAVTPNGKYAAIVVIKPSSIPYFWVGNTVIFDITNHRPICIIDTICRYTHLSFRPVLGSISDIRDLFDSCINFETKPIVSLYNNTIIMKNVDILTTHLLSLLDLTGRTVHRWQVEPKDGDKVILPLPEGLPNGIYLLRAGGGKIVGKVVLVR